MLNRLKQLFSPSPAGPDDHIWHRTSTPLLPVRLIDGSLSQSEGQLWRRWNGACWEYQQDAETDEEFASRQW